MAMPRKLEDFYTISELSKMLRINRILVTRMFAGRLGVLRLPAPKVRRYRIPQAVVKQVLEENGFLWPEQQDGE